MHRYITKFRLLSFVHEKAPKWDEVRFKDEHLYERIWPSLLKSNLYPSVIVSAYVDQPLSTGCDAQTIEMY